MEDTLTRFRVVALAAADDRFFGKGESSLQAQQPLSIRPSPPRFLNQGSQTAAVQLAIRSDNLQIEGPAGVQLEIPAGQSREVLFPVLAKNSGLAYVQALVTESRGQQDATEFEVPVHQPETTEHIASYGTLDEGARKHPVRIPNGASADLGGLEFSASSTALQELADADDYLRDYPYGCSEQIASKILGSLAARALHQDFNAGQEPVPLEPKNPAPAGYAECRRRLGLWGTFRPFCTHPRVARHSRSGASETIGCFCG